MKGTSQTFTAIIRHSTRTSWIVSLTFLNLHTFITTHLWYRTSSNDVSSNHAFHIMNSISLPSLRLLPKEDHPWI